MRIYTLATFHKWAKKESLTREMLINVVTEIEQGLIDADLGGHVFKKRVALPGRGKSGGVRTLIAFKSDNHAFFMYGFAKNQRANIKENELRALRLLAKQLLSYDSRSLSKAISAGELIEVKSDG